MPGFERVDRQTEEIRRGVDAILRELKDPRIPAMFSVIGVDLTRDLKFCKIKLSTLEDGEAERRAFLKALKGATGFIRRELGRRVFLRSMPELSFALDDSIEHGMRIQSLLNQISSKPESHDEGGEEDDGN
ncbi:MAG: 30S ribosome-binding factor RbfA [Christensenellaceae bacterium]|jgi:ribosome-binding factor A|nr:30S ribosome-binding factor RbfA [Christensenellaceae bacterium]